MQRFLVLFCVFGFAWAISPATAVAKNYKCKVKVGGNQWAVEISKGRVRAASGYHRAKQIGPKDLLVSAYGEDWSMHPKGKIRGRQGGNHNCNMDKVIKAYKGQ